MITVIPGQCEFIADFLEPSSGHELMERIRNRVRWRQQTMKIYAKSVKLPRLTAWYGDQSALYQYSGITNWPLPWFRELLELRRQLEDYVQSSFNSVLLNYYRNGNDSMGMHSDNEKELGQEPIIASLSLGATRRFIMHPKSDITQSSIKLNLPHGSLLIMSGRCQQQWKHAVPKTKQATGPRINLTFRRVDC